MCRPCTPHTRTPLTQDGRQVHTCRAESALDGHSGFAHAVMMSVQTQCCGQCGIHAPLHGCTALPPGSVHAAKGKICSSVATSVLSRRENISFLPDPFDWHSCVISLAPRHHLTLWSSPQHHRHKEQGAGLLQACWRPLYGQCWCVPRKGASSLKTDSRHPWLLAGLLAFSVRSD